jgi:hypothetical protein
MVKASEELQERDAQIADLKNKLAEAVETIRLLKELYDRAAAVLAKAGR